MNYKILSLFIVLMSLGMVACPQAENLSNQSNNQTQVNLVSQEVSVSDCPLLKSLGASTFSIVDVDWSGEVTYSPESGTVSGVCKGTGAQNCVSFATSLCANQAPAS